MEKRLKILLVGNYIADNQQSMLHFGHHLKICLKNEGQYVKYLHPPKLLGRLHFKKKFLTKWLGYIDKFIIFPFILWYQQHFFDVCHICDHSNAPYLAVTNQLHTLITCHDILAIRSAKGDFKNNPTSTTGKYLQKYISHFLKKASNVAFVSQKTAEDFKFFFEKSPPLTRIIPNGLHYPYTLLNQNTAITLIQSLNPQILDAPYILHIGSNNWYKNRLGILHLFHYLKHKKQSPLKCVFIGQTLTPDLKKIAKKLDIKTEIIETGELEPQIINALYSKAQALLFPSIQEGFGWPIIEAMASGCPVITTDLAPMNIIGKNFAYYLPPYNPNEHTIESWSQKSGLLLWKILQHPSSPEHLASAATYAQSFNSQKMVHDYLQCYYSMLHFS